MGRLFIWEPYTDPQFIEGPKWVHIYKVRSIGPLYVKVFI